jgi:hypothetical protein
LVAVAAALLSASQLEAQESKPATRPDPFEAAFKQLAKQIDNSAKEKSTVVAWVIDESGSMDAVRERLAESVAKLDAEPGEGKSLKWLVAGYSEELHMLTPRPLTELDAVSRAVRKVASDPSGKENVFIAVTQAARLLKPRAGGEAQNGIIVVVTNERGDDQNELEAAVAECERNGFRVFCLGHAAPFGTETGFVRLMFEDGFINEIPVDQGAETAFLVVVKVPTLGGDPIELNRLSFGFGSWALSRLCDATGGEYLIAQDGTKTQFAADVMAEYRPDYQPMKTIQRDVQRNVARRAVVQAAMACRQHKKVDPALNFRAERANILRGALTESQRTCAVNEFQCHQMLQLLEAGEKARKDMTDPRWQASYDLAMGQAQAALVRSVRLNVRMAQMKVAAPKIDGPKFNTWELHAVKENQKPSALETKLAAKAKEFLERVVTDHKGTPFAHVATRELERGFGWEWRQIHVEYKTPADEIKPKRRVPLIPETKTGKSVKIRKRPRIITGKF